MTNPLHDIAKVVGVKEKENKREYISRDDLKPLILKEKREGIRLYKIDEEGKPYFDERMDQPIYKRNEDEVDFI